MRTTNVGHQMLEIAIEDSVIADFPGVQVAALRVSIEDQANLASLRRELSPRLESAAAALAEFEPITSMPEIACWREAYQKLGVKPSKFASSIEALLRRAKKEDIAEIGIPAVDLYNAISILHRAPLGAYDASKLSDAPLVLRKARPEIDVFAPLGSTADRFPLNPALVVYGQEDTVLCWGFNSRDSEVSAVDDASQQILFFSEATDADGAARSVAALEELATLVAAAGGETNPVVYLDAVTSSGRV